MSKTELYIGNLNQDANQEELENVFQKYGKIKQCQVKNKGEGHVYAFIDFEDERDAEDAINGENGKDMCGSSMVVKFTKGKDNNNRRDRRDDRYGGGGRGGFRGGRGGFRGGRGGERGGGDRGGRSLECYECGQTGHFARECREKRGGGGGGGRGGRREFRGRDNFGDNGRRDRSRSFDRNRD